MITSIPTVSMPSVGPVASGIKSSAVSTVKDAATSKITSIVQPSTPSIPNPTSMVKGMAKSQLPEPSTGMSGIMDPKVDLSTFQEKSVSRLQVGGKGGGIVDSAKASASKVAAPVKSVTGGIKSSIGSATSAVQNTANSTTSTISSKIGV